MLPNQGGYTKQYDRKMKQDVGKMKMSVGEYYARKADMYETLMTGHDSKESHTQGKSSDFIYYWFQRFVFKFCYQELLMYIDVGIQDYLQVKY